MQNNFYQLGANEGEACAWLVPKITFPEFIVCVSALHMCTKYIILRYYAIIVSIVPAGKKSEKKKSWDSWVQSYSIVTSTVKVCRLNRPRYVKLASFVLPRR